MPTTKPSELRKLPVQELQKRIQDTKKELMELRFQSSIGQLDKNHRVTQAKREIARMLTVLGEKARGADGESQPSSKPASKKPRARKA
ncbi:MAG: 50S ribosomal protein L29 [Meiothermus sp.]|uniref:50S ribosomal protein L29 n=1 Tax=Meiothermus sp. TaxID=1955249 RepID=UPI0025D02A67|nr:50S ribosomal protein L29 [Meiothermus sp.]MCS7067430.1 50S ribosomal protein L29 [Meiothermus sp.]MDW8425345.1 50S ribosomal protein L29 [Meiothermus sp.]